MEVKYSVYTLSDPADHERARYVGWATDPSARLRRHIREATPHQHAKTHKNNWIRSLIAGGRLPLLCVVAMASTREQAGALESELISKLRAGGSDLTNGTDGGDGVVGPRKELRDARSAAAKRFFANPSAREKAAAITRKQFQDAEFRKRFGEIQRAAQLKRYENPEAKKRLSDGLRRYYREHPEAREKLSRVRRAYWSKHERPECSSETRGRLRMAALNQYSSAAAREAKAEAARRQWADPTIRAKHIASRKRVWMKRRTEQ